MSERDANDLISMAVMNTTDGREVGRVKDVVFDPERHMLLGLMVTRTGDPNGTETFLEMQRIRGLGKDAVTVDDDAALQPLSEQAQAKKIVDSGIHLKGTKVLTETGDALGAVQRIRLNDDGSVAGYDVASGILGLGGHTEILPGEVEKIGEDAIIVSAAVVTKKDAKENSGPTEENPAHRP